MGDCDYSPLPPTSQPQDTGEVVTRVINTCLMPLTCIAGVGAASVCILVFTRKQMRSSLHVYLAGLSVFDLILLAMSLLIYPPMQICIDQVGRTRKTRIIFGKPWREKSMLSSSSRITRDSGSTRHGVQIFLDHGHWHISIVVDSTDGLSVDLRRCDRRSLPRH